MELIDKFLKFEYENDLFNKKIKGVKFWHYIRFSLYMDIARQKYHSKEQAHTDLKNKKLIKIMWPKFKQFPYFLYRNPLWRLHQKDILVLNHQRRVKNGNYYDCIYTDEILENIKRSYYVFEGPYLEKHFKPIRTKNIKYFDYIYFITLIKRKIFKFINPNFWTLCSKDINELYLLLNNINKIFNVNIDFDKVIKETENIILNYKLSKNYYEKILNKVKPKIIVEVSSYSFSRFLFNEIATKRGIPTIELQHGIMGKYHIAYNFFKKMELSTFPDYIFLFGKRWKKDTRFPLKEGKLIVTGFPYFENRVNELRYFNKNSNKENILFVSSEGIGRKLSKLAIELEKIIDPKKYNIIYKLHPNEYEKWKDIYPWLKNRHIDVIDNNNYDIYYYFNNSNYLVGVASTTIFEGLGFNLKIFIVKIGVSYKITEELSKKKYAKLVTSAEEIAYNLGQFEENKEIIQNQYYWEPNSMKKVIKNIERIIQKKLK